MPSHPLALDDFKDEINLTNSSLVTGLRNIELGLRTNIGTNIKKNVIKIICDLFRVCYLFIIYYKGV